MDGQQIYALLGQWHDIVGARGGGGGGGGGMRGGGMRGGWGRGWGGWGGWGGGLPDAYGYVQQQPQGVDPATLWMMMQMMQQQQGQQAPPPAMPPAKASGWYDLTGPFVGQDVPGPGPGAMAFPPRAAVVDAPLPTQANRDILPMSTGVPILPTQSAQITGRPQTLVFKIGRFVISNAGTAGGAADWIVNDIKIGNRSQFVQSGDVPGDLFATNAIDTFVRFEAAQTAMDVVVVTTYIGLNESGCPFFGAMVGTAAV